MLLFRKVASICKQNEVGEAENEVKRQFGELESVHATLASNVRKMNTAAMDTSGTQQETRSLGEITNSLFVVSWNVAGTAEKDINSFLEVSAAQQLWQTISGASGSFLLNHREDGWQ